MFWSYFLAAAGQFLVCLIFCEVVSQFPISGGLYPWARRLVGKKWAWMAGWIYGWALFTTIAAVAVGAGPFVATLLGFASTPLTVTIIALVMVAIPRSSISRARRSSRASPCSDSSARSSARSRSAAIC